MIHDDQLRQAAQNALLELGKAVLAEVRWRAFEHRVVVLATIMASTAVIVVAVAYGLRYLRDLRRVQQLTKPYPSRHGRRRKRRQQ